MDGAVSATGDSVKPWPAQNLGWSIRDAPDQGKGDRPLQRSSTSHRMSTAPEQGEGLHATLGKVETSCGCNPPEEGPSCRCPAACNQLDS